MDEAAEKDLSRGGHADNAGVGEMDGDGDESLVKEGEAQVLLSVTEAGLGAMLMLLGCFVERSALDGVVCCECSSCTKSNILYCIEPTAWPAGQQRGCFGATN